MAKVEIRIGDQKGEGIPIYVQDKPYVVISSHFESAERVDDILKANGFNACFTPEKWPRDKFNSFQDRYIFWRGINFLGIGGEFVFGNDFGLASRGNLNLLSQPLSEREKDRVERERARIDIAEKFFGIPIYGMYVSRKYVKTSHIDTAVMTIPHKNYILVNQSFYEGSRSFNNLDEVAQKHRQELIKIPSSEEDRFHPLNCLVLDKNSEPFVIANEETPMLLGVLKDLGIDYETVKADDSPLWGNGSIRCRTNAVANKKLIRMANMDDHQDKRRVESERQRPNKGDSWLYRG